MNNGEEIQVSRKQILIRLLYTVLYLFIFEILKLIIQVVVLFQYIHLLITTRYSDPLRRFSNKVSAYTYQVIRYMSLNDNLRPFPFKEFPEEMEKPVEDVRFE